jgi:hypothetical protein
MSVQRTKSKKPASSRRPIIRPIVLINTRRPFTDATWQLVAVCLDEDNMTHAQIAKELRRDPDDLAAKIREAEQSGLLDAVREQLWTRSAVYGPRLRRYARQAVSEAEITAGDGAS